jgi:hypothetical protein
MKRLFTLFSLFLCVCTIHATDYYSQGSVTPSTLTNWNTIPAGGGSNPLNFTTAGDNFIIQVGNSMTTSAAWTVAGSITVNGTLTIAGHTVKVGETFDASSATSLTSSSTVATLEFNGTTLQNVTIGTNAGTLNYTINNNAGVNLTGTMTLRSGAWLVIASTSNDPVQGSGIVSYTGTTASSSTLAQLRYTSPTGTTFSGGAQTITDKVWPAANGPNAVYIDNTTAAPNNKVTSALTSDRTLIGGASALNQLTITNGIFDIANSSIAMGLNTTLNISSPNNSKMIVTTGTGYLKVYFAAAAFSSFSFPVGDISGTADYSELYVLYSTAASAASFIGVKVQNSIISGDMPGTDFAARNWSMTHETVVANAPSGSAFTSNPAFTMQINGKGPSTDVTGTTTNMRLFKNVAGVYTQLNSGSSVSAPNYNSGNAFFTGTFPATSETGINGYIYAPRTYLGQQTYTWNGATTDYQVPTNWTPTRSSIDAADILQFDGTPASPTVTNIPLETIGKLIISGNAQVTWTSTNTVTVGGGATTGAVESINVGAGSKLTIASTGGLSITGPPAASPRTGAINGIVETASSGAFTISSSNTTIVTFGSTGVFNYGSTATAGITNSAGAAFLVWSNGSTLNHLRTGGGTMLPTGTYITGSNVNIGTSGAPVTSLSFSPVTTFPSNVTMFVNLSSTIAISLSGPSTFAGIWNITSTGAGRVRFSGSSTNTWTFSNAVTVSCSNAASGIELSTASTSGTAPVYNFSFATAPSLSITGGALAQQATATTTAGFTTVNIANGLTIGNNGSIQGNSNTGAYTSGDMTVNINNGDLTFGTGTTMGGTASTSSTTTAKLLVSFLNGANAQTFTPAVTTTGRTQITVNKSSSNVSLATRALTTNNVTLAAGKLVLGNNNLTITAATGATSSSGVLSGGGAGTNYVVTDGTGTVTISSVPIAYSISKNRFPIGFSTSIFDPISILPGTAGAVTVRVRGDFATAPRNAASALARAWEITLPNASTIEFQTGLGTVATPYIGKLSSGTWTEVASAGAGPNEPYAYSLAAQTTGTYAVGSQYSFAPVSLTSAATGNFTAPASWTPVLAPTSVDALTVVSGHNITLDVPVTVKNLTLTSGTIDLGANNLTISNSLTAIGSQTNHITTSGLGKLIQSVGAGVSKTFPVGISSGSYDPVTVTPTNTVSFSVNVKPSFSNAVINLAKVVNSREWDVSATAAGSTIMELTADATLTPPTGGVDVIGHYNVGWNTLDVTGVTRVGNKYTGTNASGLFSPFGVGIEGGFTVVLAVELKKITAYANGKINRVEWSTVSEKNMKDYIVERSADGINAWETVSKQSANNKDDSKYSVEDASVSALTFYRVKSVELNGKEGMSKIVSVKRETKGKLNISKAYPNPTVEAVQIDFEVTSNSNVTVTMTDVLGRVVSNKQVQAVEGLNRLDVNLNSVAKGIYILTLQEGNNIVTQRIVKQ